MVTDGWDSVTPEMLTSGRNKQGKKYRATELAWQDGQE